MLRAIDILKHYGLYDEIMRHSGVGHLDNPPGRGSGRYGWGTGENPYQRAGSFLQRIAEYEAQGLDESQIADILKCTVTSLRAQKSLAGHMIKNELAQRIERMRDKGMSWRAIGAELGMNEATARSLVNETRQARRNAAINLAE